MLLSLLRAGSGAKSTAGDVVIEGLIGSLFGDGGSRNEEVPADPVSDREKMMTVLFGRAAPSANKVVGFLGTTRGQQVLGVVTVATAAALLPKVMR